VGKQGYEDKFDDVVSYIELKLSEKRERRRIRNDGDLRKLFEELDSSRRGGEKRMSKAFMDELLDTNAAQQAKGKILPTGEYLQKTKKNDELRHFRINSRFDGGMKNWRLFTYASNGDDLVKENKLDRTLEKGERKRALGKDVYYYKRRNGTTSQAVKSYGKRGTIRFHDVNTGQFVGKHRIKEEDDE
jgi:hypothetical protein